MFLASSPAHDVIRSMVLTMGAYLGELIVRNGGGPTICVPIAAGIDLPSGRRCFPHNRVGKRLTIAPESAYAADPGAALQPARRHEGRRPLLPTRTNARCGST